MSERLISAAAAINDVEPGYPSPVPRVALVREAVAALCWGTMAYRCDACGFEWDVWLGLGVEGPPAIRDYGLYAASPFTVGSCPAWPVNPNASAEEKATFRHLGKCDGGMTHVRFGDDREFAPMLPPDDAPRFVLDHWYDCATLVIPEPALIRARRFHAEGPA